MKADAPITFKSEPCKITTLKRILNRSNRCAEGVRSPCIYYMLCDRFAPRVGGTHRVYITMCTNLLFLVFGMTRRQYVCVVQ